MGLLDVFKHTLRALRIQRNLGTACAAGFLRRRGFDQAMIDQALAPQEA